MKQNVLAGQLKDLGDTWLGTLTGWGSKGLLAALIIIVVARIVQRFSVKAGIGALLGLVLCLGIYQSRDKLADMFSDEVNDPKGAPVVQVQYPTGTAAPQVTPGGEVL